MYTYTNRQIFESAEAFVSLTDSLANTFTSIANEREEKDAIKLINFSKEGDTLHIEFAGGTLASYTVTFVSNDEPVAMESIVSSFYAFYWDEHETGLFNPDDFQAVCKSRDSDVVDKFVRKNDFSQAMQEKLHNGDIWGVYYSDSGVLVAEDTQGNIIIPNIEETE